MCHYSTSKHQVGRTLSRHKRSKCLNPPLTPRGQLCVYAYIYMKNVLKRKYSFCCVDNCKRYNWEAWWKCSLEYFMCRHMVHQKGQRAVWSIDPKAKETFTMFTHQFNMYKKIKFIVSPGLNPFSNMQEHKQINKSILSGLKIKLHFEEKKKKR